MDWILKGRDHAVRSISRDIISREFLASQPRDAWLAGRKRRGLLMRFGPTPFSEQICQ